MSDYPEHDKLKAAREAGSEQIGEFLEWLLERYTLAFLDERNDERLVPSYLPITTLLAQYFGVDLVALEHEKRAMLDEVRAAFDARSAP